MEHAYGSPVSLYGESQVLWNNPARFGLCFSLHVGHGSSSTPIDKLSRVRAFSDVTGCYKHVCIKEEKKEILPERRANCR